LLSFREHKCGVVVALRWAPCGPGLSLQAFEAMALPIAIQQTITDVQSHYKKLHEQAWVS